MELQKSTEFPAIKKSMTIPEAIAYIDNHIMKTKHGTKTGEALYIAIDALKKQMLTKPNEMHVVDYLPEEEKYVLARCPSCETHINSHFSKHCRECGQAIDWSQE